MATSIALGEREAASVLAAYCVLLANLATVDNPLLAAPAHLLGAAAALLGKADEARNYYRQALEVSERIQNRPEIALTRLHLAELLLDESAKPNPLDLRTSPPQGAIDVGARSPRPGAGDGDLSPLQRNGARPGPSRRSPRPLRLRHQRVPRHENATLT